MQVDLLRTACRSQLYHRQNVIFMTVHATCREQAHNVHGFTLCDGVIYRARQRRVAEEGTLFDLYVQTGEILINNAARAQIDVTNFRVTHLAVRQAHFEAGSVNQRVRTFRPQCIHDRRFGIKNSVILLIFAVAVAIQNHQYHRFFSNRHCDNPQAHKTKNLPDFTTTESIK